MVQNGKNTDFVCGRHPKTSAKEYSIFHSQLRPWSGAKVPLNRMHQYFRLSRETSRQAGRRLLLYSARTHARLPFIRGTPRVRGVYIFYPSEKLCLIHDSVFAAALSQPSPH